MEKEIINSIERSFEENAKLSNFNKKYKELIKSFLHLRREAAIVDILVNEVSLPQRWFIKYPELEKDLAECDLSDRLLGLNITPLPIREAK